MIFLIVFIGNIFASSRPPRCRSISKRDRTHFTLRRFETAALQIFASLLICHSVFHRRIGGSVPLKASLVRDEL